MDSTVIDLPLVGESVPNPLSGQPEYDPNGELAAFLNDLRKEASLSRDPYVAPHEACQLLYLYGSLNPNQPHRFNKVQGMVQTFVQLATQTPPQATLTPAVVTDGGPPIPTATGEVRFLDCATITQFFQPILDLKLQLGRAKQFYRTMAEKSAIFGWYDALYDWDPLLKLPILRPIPALQWYKDPTEEETKDLHYVGLDWPIDAEEAKRLYPMIAEAIDAAASTEVATTDGATTFSGVYEDTDYARPIVTLSIWWLRNHEAQMTDQEAILTGLVEARQVPDETAAMPQGETDGDVPGSDGGVTDGAAAEGPGRDPAVEEAAKADGDVESPSQGDSAAAGPGNTELPDGAVLPPLREALFLKETGEEVTPLSPNWPRKRVIRQCVQLMGKVVDDRICDHWDIPVISNYNVRIPGRPFGQGEPIRVAEIQADKNTVHSSLVDHARWFKGSSAVLPKSMKDELPDGGKNFFIEPNKSYYLDDDLIRQWGDKVVNLIKPPELSASVVTVDDKLDAAFDDVAGRPDALKGKPPTENSSGRLFEQSFAAGATTTAFRFSYLEEMWYRVARLTFHSLLKLPPEDLYAINKTYPPEVVPLILEYARAMEWDISVKIESEATRQAKRAEVFAHWQAGLIDPQTAIEELGYDKKTVLQRMNMQMQAQAAVAGATQNGSPQQPNGKGQDEQPAGNGSSNRPPQKSRPATES